MHKNIMTTSDPQSEALAQEMQRIMHKAKKKLPEGELFIIQPEGGISKLGEQLLLLLQH